MYLVIEIFAYIFQEKVKWHKVEANK